jgi:hypothetical protein
VDRALPGSLRPGLGPLAGGDLRAPAVARPGARGHRAHPAAALGAAVGVARRPPT